MPADNRRSRVGQFIGSKIRVSRWSRISISQIHEAGAAWQWRARVPADKMCRTDLFLLYYMLAGRAHCGLSVLRLERRVRLCAHGEPPRYSFSAGTAPVPWSRHTNLLQQSVICAKWPHCIGERVICKTGPPLILCICLSEAARKLCVEERLNSCR